MGGIFAERMRKGRSSLCDLGWEAEIWGLHCRIYGHLRLIPLGHIPIILWGSELGQSQTLTQSSLSRELPP